MKTTTNWREWVRTLIAQHGEDATEKIVFVLEKYEHAYEHAMESYKMASDIANDVLTERRKNIESNLFLEIKEEK